MTYNVFGGMLNFVQLQHHEILTSHPEQLISFAFSSKEPATTTSPLCFLKACHVNFAICQCLY